MSRLKLAMMAALALGAGAIASGPTSAAVGTLGGIQAAVDEIALSDNVQYVWRGRRYCWYPDGWHGPGWYRCGFHWRHGFGWGGPVGWHGWHVGGDFRERRVFREHREFRTGLPSSEFRGRVGGFRGGMEGREFRGATQGREFRGDIGRGGGTVGMSPQRAPAGAGAPSRRSAPAGAYGGGSGSLGAGPAGGGSGGGAAGVGAGGGGAGGGGGGPAYGR